MEEGTLQCNQMHALRECDLSPLYPDYLKPLSNPVTLFEFDFAKPPLTERSAYLEVCLGFLSFFLRQR